jgi:hypothetical protein
MVSTPTQPEVPHSVEGPVVLWDRVLQARLMLARLRDLPRSPLSSLARAELVTALEEYVLCLTRRGRPIPYQLRSELQIRRLTRYE